MYKRLFVSVIIPCFNDGKYLREAVDSVLNSTYKNYEIIIVDDGSTDNTKEIAAGLVAQDKRISYIYQENAGLSAARNTGIQTSFGEYILPLDADDRISSDYIDKAVKHIGTNSMVKVVYCEAEFFDGKNGNWKLPPFSRRLLARENMIFCCALYRKSSWVEAGGYSREMKKGWEDWEFWISILKNGGDVYKLPIIGFFYRIKNNSMRKGMTKANKAMLIKYLNSQHRDFFLKELGGPLYKSRSLSRLKNKINKLLSIRLYND